MNPPAPSQHLERRLFVLCSLLLTLGYLAVAAAYFIAPQGWTMGIEHWCYRHLPLYHEMKSWGGLFLIVLWLAGCVLLLTRAWALRRIPWRGLLLAVLPPLLLLAYNSAFFYAAERLAPLSLGR